MKDTRDSRDLNSRVVWLKKQEMKAQRRAYIYALNHLMKETFDSAFYEFMRQKERKSLSANQLNV